MNPVEGEERNEKAEKLARLAQLCRQMSGMMEAGVDILRITRVVRSQTDDEDILRLCERIDYDLKMGRAISDALSDEPSLFSPFAVTLVRQGEERSDLAHAFARVAQAFDQERHELSQPAPSPQPNSTPAAPTNPPPQVLAASPTNSAPGPALAPHAPSDASAWLEKAEPRWVRAAGGVGAGLLAASALSEALVVLGVLPAKWQRPLSRALSAGVLAALALSQRTGEALQSHAPPAPQVLAAPPEAHAPQETRPQDAEEPAAQSPEPPQQEALPEAPRPEPNAVYTGAPRDDEEEQRRVVRRPPEEEDFD